MAVVAVVAVIVAETVNVGNISIIDGWFPVALFWVTVVPCVTAAVLRRDVLPEFAIGIPIGIGIAVLLLRGASPHAGDPDRRTPVHVRMAVRGVPHDRAWCSPGGGGPTGPAASAAWSRSSWPLVSAGSAVNQTFAYYPTFDRLFGKSANHFLDNAQLNAMREAGGQDRPAARPRCHPERFHPRARA